MGEVLPGSEGTLRVSSHTCGWPRAAPVIQAGPSLDRPNHACLVLSAHLRNRQVLLSFEGSGWGPLSTMHSDWRICRKMGQRNELCSGPDSRHIHTLKNRVSLIDTNCENALPMLGWFNKQDQLWQRLTKLLITGR